MKLHQLTRARDGDALAKEEVVRALRPRLAKMAGYYARRCQTDADDLLQEAWIGLLRALPELDINIGDPEQYLIQYARWHLLDAIRRIKHFQQLSEEDDLPGDINSSGEFNAIELGLFLAELDERQRRIIGYLLAGLTWREAGEALGCTSANIAYHMRQIRRRYESWQNG